MLLRLGAPPRRAGRGWLADLHVTLDSPWRPTAYLGYQHPWSTLDTNTLDQAAQALGKLAFMN